VPHGFLRTPHGSFTTFDAPGAGTGTFPYSINFWGAITGFGRDSSWVYHGFLRAPRNAFITFDAPGAGTGTYQGTSPRSINSWGAITGYYLDADNIYHGFLRRGSLLEMFLMR
jgi:hypothetical protein